MSLPLASRIGMVISSGIIFVMFRIGNKKGWF